MANASPASRILLRLTLLDEESELEPPERASWENPGRDLRIDWSVLTLIDEEGPSCRHQH